MAHTPMAKIDWHKMYLKKTRNKPQFGDSEFKKYKMQEKPFVNFVKKFVERGGRILDCGTGLGRAALFLSLEGFRVVAVDNSPKMLSIAGKNIRNFGGKAEMLLADLTRLPFKPGKFDAIVHQGILEHFSEKEAVHIIRRHLKIAPLTIFSVPILSSHTEN